MKSAWTTTAPRGETAVLPDTVDTDALWRDGAYFWIEVDARPDEVRRAMYQRYPLISRNYTDRYFDQILTEHRLNPLAPLYIESELGAPARQLALLAELEHAGLSLAGKRCLDIGCSNGSLLLAAKQKGAAHCVGVDVSEGRINSARQLCDGSGIDLRVLDLATADLPAGCGPFDVMFCTDVLEHVQSIPGILTAMARHLARDADARIFVTVFNHLNTACVASEPHFGVPGLVLIDRDTAAEVWNTVRAQLKSNLDYEVEDWPEYASLTESAQAVGLKITPHLNTAEVLANRHRFWGGYQERLVELERSTTARLEELEMSPAHRLLLRDSIRAYCRDALASHRAFESEAARMSDDEVVGFYLRYYAQPIRFFLTRT